MHLNVDNHIQIFHLGRYIVGYMLGNRVLRLRSRITVKQISDRISYDIPPQMKILNTVIPLTSYLILV